MGIPKHVRLKSEYQITPEIILKVMPRNPNPDVWAEAFTEAFERFGITAGYQIAHILSQCAYDSWECTQLYENLDINPERLLILFPVTFRRIREAEDYAHKPESLANYVYSNRFGNGGEESGDGYRYRGRGLIKVRYKRNYLRYGDSLDLKLADNPDLLVEPKNAAMAAALLFINNVGIAATAADVGRVTILTAGNRNGLRIRELYFRRAIIALCPSYEK